MRNKKIFALIISSLFAVSVYCFAEGTKQTESDYRVDVDWTKTSPLDLVNLLK